MQSTLRTSATLFDSFIISDHIYKTQVGARESYLHFANLCALCMSVCVHAHTLLQTTTLRLKLAKIQRKTVKRPTLDDGGSSQKNLASFPHSTTSWLRDLEQLTALYIYTSLFSLPVSLADVTS